MKKEIEQLFTHAKSVALTHDEKKNILTAIIGADTTVETVRNTIPSRLHQVGRVSPFARQYSRLSPLGLSRFRATVLMTAIIVLLGTTGAYAQMALPGELLYPMKIHVNEKLEYIAARTPKAKALLEATFADRRLEEAATLLYKNKLTVHASEELALGFSIYSDKLVAHLNDLRQSGDGTDAAEINSLYTASLHTHRDVLQVLAASSPLKGKFINTVDSTTRATSTPAKTRVHLETAPKNETAPFVPKLNELPELKSTTTEEDRTSTATPTVEVQQSTTMHVESGNTPVLPHVQADTSTILNILPR